MPVYPFNIQLGPLQVTGYGIMMMVGFLVGGWLIGLELQRRRLNRDYASDIVFAALIAANVSFMRMFGLGLTLAVLVDATLVRMVLVPAFMRLMGGWNWWAPHWLQRVHQRLGFNEAPKSDPDSSRQAEQVPS